MVILHVKYMNVSQCLYNTTVNTGIDEIAKELVSIYNGKLKIEWICSEFEDLSKHGACLPSAMQGLTADQIVDLKLRDQWAETHLDCGNYVENPDPIGKRNGKAPVEKYSNVLTKTAAEAKAKVSKKLVDANMCLTLADVQDTLDMLKGAMIIAYPMGLPHYEPVRQAFETEEISSRTLLGEEVLEQQLTDLWWANKQLERNKKLCDYIGQNEKSKLIVKLQKRGQGAPGREPVLTEEQRKMLMLAEYKRQEELKRLEESDDDGHMNSSWADNKMLQKSFQGLRNIHFNFR